MLRNSIFTTTAHFEIIECTLRALQQGRVSVTSLVWNTDKDSLR